MYVPNQQLPSLLLSTRWFPCQPGAGLAEQTLRQPGEKGVWAGGRLVEEVIAGNRAGTQTHAMQSKVQIMNREEGIVQRIERSCSVKTLYQKQEKLKNVNSPVI